MEKERLKVFSERLTELRKEKELTQLQLSEALEIPRVSITRYETAERTPTIDHLLQFSQFFKVPTDYLLGLSDVKSYNADLQSVCKYIGLNEQAVKILNEHFGCYKNETDRDYNYFIKISSEEADIASDFVSCGLFHDFIENIRLLETYGKQWVEECKKNIAMWGLNFEGNQESEELLKNCEYTKYEINETIADFVQRYDIRYRECGIETYFTRSKIREMQLLELMKKQILAGRGIDIGEHNPPKE